MVIECQAAYANQEGLVKVLVVRNGKMGGGHFLVCKRNEKYVKRVVKEKMKMKEKYK